MGNRKPVAAGRFYAADRKKCLEELKQCLIEADSITAEQVESDRIVAGIVPHAGWVFSGALASKVFSTIKNINSDVDTFVIFGAVHCYMKARAAVYPDGMWESPLGNIKVDTEVANAILSIDTAQPDKDVHSAEHSIEVQIPFIQHLFNSAKIVPVMVGPDDNAAEFGAKAGRVIGDIKDKKIVCIASTDLTHYGPNYGFYPHGQGEEGIRWATEVNDKEFIDLVMSMKAEDIVTTANANYSACGAGATAAAVAAAREMGAKKALLLGHTNSSDVMIEKFHQQSTESVGYAGIVLTI